MKYNNYINMSLKLRQLSSVVVFIFIAFNQAMSQEITTYAGQCNWCLVSNMTTNFYCVSNNKCYASSPGGSCINKVSDLFTNACGSDVCLADP